MLTSLTKTLDVPKQFEDGVPKEVTSIVRHLMNHDADIRPTALEVQQDQHSYIKKLKKKAIKQPFLEATLTVKYMAVSRKHEIRKKASDCEPKEPGCSIGIEHLIDRVPQPFEIRCPICLDILTNPHQTECCGTNYCKGCIERIMIGRKPCPTCKNKGIKLYHNKGLQKEIYKIPIRCVMNNSGCKWIGELGQLDSHLNSKPNPDKQLAGCKYIKIECIYCSKMLKRSDISVHQKDHCKKRPYNCCYCQSYESNYGSVVKEHWPVCVFYPVECSNCGTKVPRQSMKDHLSSMCSKVGILCTAGCKQIILLQDMFTHLIEAHIPETLKQTFTQAHERQFRQLECERYKVHNLKDENQRLKEELKLANQAKKREKSQINDLQLISRFKSTPETTHSFLIQAPPSYIEIECPVCLNIVKEPYQVHCCGSNFCHTCIQQVLSIKGSCPFCKSPLNDVGFFNRGLDRAVRQLNVHCLNKGEGCEWKGEYGELDKHLDPKEANSCAFLTVRCVNCNAMVESKKERIHIQRECQKRPYRCPYCKVYESSYDDITENHWRICQSYPVQCPLNCNEKIPRKFLAKHVQTHYSRNRSHLLFALFIFLIILIVYGWYSQ